MYPQSKDDLLMDMLECEQRKNVCVLGHGKNVHKNYRKILRQLKGRRNFFPVFELPDFFENPDITQFILKNQLRFQDVREYQIFHDCGKPYCRSVGDDGKVHFKDHEKISAEVARLVKFNPTVISLIENDMLFHKENFSGVIANNVKLHCTLALTAIAELYENSVTFEEISFKIKRKKIFSNIKKMVSKYMKS